MKFLLSLAVVAVLSLSSNVAHADLEAHYNPDTSPKRCFEIFIAYDYQLYNMLLENNVRFANYSAYKKLNDLNYLEASIFEKNQMPDDLIFIALDLMDSYDPAQYFLIQIYKEIYDPKDAEETLADIKEYYELLKSYELTGERLVRFAQSVQYNVDDGATLLAEDHPILFNNWVIN